MLFLAVVRILFVSLVLPRSKFRWLSDVCWACKREVSMIIILARAGSGWNEEGQSLTGLALAESRTIVLENRMIMSVYTDLTALISSIPPAAQILIAVACVFIIRRLLKPRLSKQDENEGERRFSLPQMKKRDFTVQELLEFDGVKNERVLLAVCGKVFDVTKGKSFYGPGLQNFWHTCLVFYIVNKLFIYIYWNGVYSHL